MSNPACPMCEMTEVLNHPERWECVTCGHEWEQEPEPAATAAARVVKDAHGNVLVEGDLGPVSGLTLFSAQTTQHRKTALRVVQAWSEGRGQTELCAAMNS